MRTLDIVRRLLGVLLCSIVLLYLARILVTQWPLIIEAAKSGSIASWAAGLAFFIVADVCFAFAWLNVHGGLHEHKSQAGLLRVYAFSWLARYLPGKIIGITTRVVGARNLGFPLQPSIVGVGYELVLQIITAVVCGSLLILISSYYPVRFQWVLNVTLLVAVALLVLILLVPDILTNLPFSKESTHLARRSLYYAIILMLTAHLFAGLGVVSVAPGNWDMGVNLYVMGAGTLSGALGTILAVTPAGIGTREGLLAAMLAPVMQPAAGVFTGLFSRCLRIVGDLIFTGICYTVDPPK